jgi:hypothetical protein
MNSCPREEGPEAEGPADAGPAAADPKTDDADRMPLCTPVEKKDLCTSSLLCDGPEAPEPLTSDPLMPVVSVVPVVPAPLLWPAFVIATISEAGFESSCLIRAL